MSATISKDELSKSLNRRSLSRSRRMSFGSTSVRSWASASVTEVLTAPGGDVFQINGKENDDEDELKWAAIERLPTYDRLRKGILKQTLDDGKIVHQEVDVMNLGFQDKKQLMESILRIVEEDNERFLLRLRDRTDR